MGVTVVFSDLLCGQTQQLWPLERRNKTMARKATDPPSILPAFISQVFMFADTSHLNLSLFPPPNSARAQAPHKQPAQASAAA